MAFDRAKSLHWGTVASLLGLIALSVAWEFSLAPLRPGGSWLALKVVPLLLPLIGILQARRLYDAMGVDADPAVFCRRHRARHQR